MEGRIGMAITQQQVQEACGKMERCLEEFRSDPRNVEELQRALAAQRWLRNEYRANRLVLDPFADRLRALGRAIGDVIRSARQALTEEYLRAAEAVEASRRRREACRDALIELAQADKVQRFDSPRGWIDVIQVRSVTLPKTGTPEREELIALIRESGHWEAVAQPNSRKLSRALDQGLFTSEQAGRLTRLCPVETVCRLTGHFHNR